MIPHSGERGGGGGVGSVRVLGCESPREEAVEEKVAGVVAVAEEAGMNQLRAETWPTSRCKNQIKVDLVDENFTELRGEIGPPDTPYEGGRYQLEIKIPAT